MILLGKAIVTALLGIGVVIDLMCIWYYEDNKRVMPFVFSTLTLEIIGLYGVWG